MARTCSISCPSCRRSVDVWVTGKVNCSSCGHGFDVGVYSPPPERFGPGQLRSMDGFSITGEWIQIGNRAYPLTDIVGTSLTREGWGWRPCGVALLLIFTLAAGFGQQWLIALGFVMLMLGLLRQMWAQPEKYVVSWITRRGREDRRILRDRSAAVDLLRVLRGPIALANQTVSGPKTHSCREGSLVSTNSDSSASSLEFMRGNSSKCATEQLGGLPSA